jgi:hypothetical protein
MNGSYYGMVESGWWMVGAFREQFWAGPVDPLER